MGETEATREQEQSAAEPDAGAVSPGESDEGAAVEVRAETQKKKQDKYGGYIWGTGRRKTAIARVRIKPGSGKVTVNKRRLEEYFPVQRRRKVAVSPASVSKMAKRIDIWVNLSGGGPTGQSGAMMMGLARALVKMDATLEPLLRSDGYLTRDARMVERKKYGRRGARRSPQYSKR